GKRAWRLATPLPTEFHLHLEEKAQLLPPGPCRPFLAGKQFTKDRKNIPNVLKRLQTWPAGSTGTGVVV
ncbi:MAG: hypothetical protein ACLQU1_13335, partial [Bryobacteraceae bacterium]